MIKYGEPLSKELCFQDDNFVADFILTSFDSQFFIGICWKQMAAVAALCVQYEAEFRPNMSIVVTALQPLLNTRPGAPRGKRH